jgi:hypothetical protein
MADAAAKMQEEGEREAEQRKAPNPRSDRFLEGR